MTGKIVFREALISLFTCGEASRVDFNTIWWLIMVLLTCVSGDSVNNFTAGPLHGFSILFMFRHAPLYEKDYIDDK